jgi:hypothetical protein
MKLYESYVAEARAKRRRRMATGIAGAVMLATVAAWALLTLSPPGATTEPFSAGCASDARSHPAACDRAHHRRAG